MAIKLDGIKARGATLRRMTQIANVLFKQGFEAFVEKTPLASLVTSDCRAEVEEACRCEEEKGYCPCGHALPLPERLLNTVIALGPTFIKIGQVASTRPDLVPMEFSQSLKRLQEQVPPFPYEEARQIVEQELGMPIETAFRRFDQKPVASASLAQVHFAELPDGTPIAVKVQRPGIQATIEQDLNILRWLARQVARFYPGVRNLRPEAAVEEFGRWTLRELDFRVEGKNLDEFRRNFAASPDVVFPKVYWDHTTERLLTMQRVAGLRVHEVVTDMRPEERKKLTRRLAEIELQMFITDAFFHADMHPGNIFFTPDGKIVILDVGMVGRMSPELQDRFLSYWIAIIRQQRQRALHHLLEMSLSTENADLAAFESLYNAVLDKFYDAPLSERSLAQTYLEILLVGSEYNIIFPSEMMLQAKAVVTTEALDLVLDPSFQFTEEARPIVARALAQRASPGYLMDRLWGVAAEFVLLGEIPPAGPLTTQDNLDERRFRREVIRSLAYVWAEDVDGKLRDKQGDVDSYASAGYWLEHPELHAVLKTGLGLLRMLSMQMDRGLWASEPLPEIGNGKPQAEIEPAHLVTDNNGKDGSGSRVESEMARFRAFRNELYERDGKGRPYTRDARQMTQFWEEQSADFVQPEYWDDKQILRAGLKGGLTMLRLFASQMAQAIEAGQDEDAANDPIDSAGAE